MPIIQVRNVPEKLYAAVKARAAQEGVSMSELVVRSLRSEVERPSIEAWARRVEERHAACPPVDVDVTGLIDATRHESG